MNLQRLLTLTLYVKYTQTGTDNVSTVFSDNERFKQMVVGSLVVGSSSAQLQDLLQLQLVHLQILKKVYMTVVSLFVYSKEIVLDKYTDTPSYRIGLGCKRFNYTRSRYISS